MSRAGLGILIVLGITVFLSAVLSAQEGARDPQNDRRPFAGADGDSSPAERTATTAVEPSRPYPPLPRSFFRGHLSTDRAGRRERVVGNYLNLWGFVPVLVLFLLWTRTCAWANEDSEDLQVRPRFWNSMLLVCGVAGFLAVLCLPAFLLGFGALALLYALPLGLYIQERNSRVPESAKVMTPEHIRTVTVRTLARFGIEIGPKEVQQAATGPPIVFIGKSSNRLSEADRSRHVESSKGYLAAKELVYDGLLRRATDIHLEPKDGQVAVRIRIDGVMYPADPFDGPTGESLINIFKVLSNMDITEKRRPQDGSFRAQVQGRRDIDFRLATQGTQYGEKMSIRILDQSQSVRRLSELGLRKRLQDQIREIVHQSHGMFLCCGPTGAGKSTTLYACLKELDATQRNIITVEDPAEYRMDNVNQIEINSKAGQTFANSLRSILRQDPDVLLIGEIRDAETGSLACQAANTGHMVFSTVHSNDTVTALYRLLELDVEPFMVAHSVSAILGQRLVRRLCPACKEPYRPNPDVLKKAGLPPERVDKFYRPPKRRKTTCSGCGGLGYRGRIGVFEYLMITDPMRELIREKAPLSAVKAEARKNGMLYMREEGLRLVAKGITSIEELLRVVR